MCVEGNDNIRARRQCVAPGAPDVAAVVEFGVAGGLLHVGHLLGAAGVRGARPGACLALHWQQIKGVAFSSSVPDMLRVVVMVV